MGGGGRRAVTNAHVALSLDASTLFNNMPQSFGDLFKSPALANRPSG